ncbi:MAG: 4-(cytidine 5'-diphospho)-2-C-methyl-D-erythritol kinase [Pseudomonadota bacterium]|jgi:4-diphosphocytidyl-2-C-methyl-D-erythritol kinase|nr:4-(cytidine 5'-diphospho)-2-C-methyl-D-erythritol kinase [Pseudomonadota bacterium]
MAINVFAPAKVNLSLHITGQRADGYHLLDSLVAFAPVGDRLVLSAGQGFTMSVDGPEGAGVPVDDSNLALRGARLVSENGVHIALTKDLPAAAGIGGGSSDAAAAIRGACALFDAPMPDKGAILSLGSDVPMCMMPAPARATGIGGELERVALPRLPAVLVNPRVPVSTPSVFRTLTRRDNPPMPDVPAFAGVPDAIAWLADQRNDMQAAAIAIEPMVATVLDALGDTGAALSRMSGSGATCFGLYPTDAAARAAGAAIAAAHPDWWVRATWLGDVSDKAVPQVA